MPISINSIESETVYNNQNCINNYSDSTNCYHPQSAQTETHISSNEINIDLDYTITQQRMGGSSMHSDLITIDGMEFHNMDGNIQLWSGGIQHFNFTNKDGVVIEFNKNISGEIEDLVINKAI
jgi:hypothetical protein